MTSGAEQALDRLIKRDDDYAAVVEAVYRHRYTGSYTVHCLNGVPHKVEFPGIQIALNPRADPPALDKSDKVADSP